MNNTVSVAIKLPLTGAAFDYVAAVSQAITDATMVGDTFSASALAALLTHLQTPTQTPYPRQGSTTLVFGRM